MATTVYEREDGQRRRLVLNSFAVVLFFLDPMMTMVSAFFPSDISTLKELVAPTTDLLASGILRRDLSYVAFPGQNFCLIGMTVLGGISATKHSSRVGAFFAGMGFMLLLIRLSFLLLA